VLLSTAALSLTFMWLLRRNAELSCSLLTFWRSVAQLVVSCTVPILWISISSEKFSSKFEGYKIFNFREIII
jgi:hypothetical protein